MNLFSIRNYYRFVLYSSIALLLILPDSVSSQTLKGKVYSFKNLELNHIKVQSKKLGNTVYTQADGSFSIQCHAKDKIIFSGQGFEKTSKEVSSDSVFVKMIFKGSEKNRNLVINNNHVTCDALDFSIAYFSAYNCPPCPHSMYNCYPCPHILHDSYTNKNAIQHKNQLSMYSNLEGSQSNSNTKR